MSHPAANAGKNLETKGTWNSLGNRRQAPRAWSGNQRTAKKGFLLPSPVTDPKAFYFSVSKQECCGSEVFRSPPCAWMISDLIPVYPPARPFNSASCVPPGGFNTVRFFGEVVAGFPAELSVLIHFTRIYFGWKLCEREACVRSANLTHAAICLCALIPVPRLS